MLKSIKFSAYGNILHIQCWNAFSESEVKSYVLSVTRISHQGLCQNIRKHFWLPMVYVPRQIHITELYICGSMKLKAWYFLARVVGITSQLSLMQANHDNCSFKIHFFTHTTLAEGPWDLYPFYLLGIKDHSFTRIFVYLLLH